MARHRPTETAASGADRRPPIAVRLSSSTSISDPARRRSSSDSVSSRWRRACSSITSASVRGGRLERARRAARPPAASRPRSAAPPPPPRRAAPARRPSRRLARARAPARPVVAVGDGRARDAGVRRADQVDQPALVVAAAEHQLARRDAADLLDQRLAGGRLGGAEIAGRDVQERQAVAAPRVARRRRRRSWACADPATPRPAPRPA